MLGAPPIEIFLVLLLPLRFLLVIPVVQRSRADIYRLPALSGKTVGKVSQRAQNPVADPHAVLGKRLALRIPSLDLRLISWRLGALHSGVLGRCGADRLLLVNWQKVTASRSSATCRAPGVWHECTVCERAAIALHHIEKAVSQW